MGMTLDGLVKFCPAAVPLLLLRHVTHSGFETKPTTTDYMVDYIEPSGDVDRRCFNGFKLWPQPM